MSGPVSYTHLDVYKRQGLNIIVVCGRPYHIDPEINHGINDLITSFGFVLVTEDALSYLEGYAPRKVLNQWTFPVSYTHLLPDLMRYKYQKLRALHGKGEGDGSRDKAPPAVEGVDSEGAVVDVYKRQYLYRTEPLFPIGNMLLA